MSLNYKLHMEDCRTTCVDLRANSIDLVVTSPPYDNLRDYSGYDGYEWSTQVWQDVIRHLLRVVKPGGVVVWIVADATIKYGETGTSFRQASDKLCGRKIAGFCCMIR